MWIFGPKMKKTGAEMVSLTALAPVLFTFLNIISRFNHKMHKEPQFVW